MCDRATNTTPRLCRVDREYIKYMHKCDSKVSVKANRPFVALVLEINDQTYVLPLTSTTNAARISDGKNARSPLVTTKVMDGDEEIADILYNNMFPASDKYITDIVIDPIVDTYLANEERFIRKNLATISQKAHIVYTKRYDSKNRDYKFLRKICCDFKKLEEKAQEYEHNK